VNDENANVGKQPVVQVKPALKEIETDSDISEEIAPKKPVKKQPVVQLKPAPKEIETDSDISDDELTGIEDIEGLEDYSGEDLDFEDSELEEESDSDN
jgi:hypothetical protein